ncbi:MAG: HAD-IA family hydrolase [Nanoarchaeota archaeon]|nr:HAD-IA family hydrolase [Nanoarchaeota archaeon]MBU0962536.1 HAD-IA family hydrolase [Nanoarchaeota archaeon]
MKPLITFDLDNTLLNSDKAHVIAYQYALKKLKLKVLKDKEIYIHFGKPKKDVAKAISKSDDQNIIKKIGKYHDKYLWSKSYKLSKIIPCVEKTLKYLKPKYKIAVISNCSHKSIIKLLKGARLNKKYFDIIIGDDNVKHPKPWPDELFLAEKLAKENAVYHIGDSIYDIRAAKKARIKAIAVLSGHYTKEQLKKERPFKIIRYINELKYIL